MADRLPGDGGPFGPISSNFASTATPHEGIGFCSGRKHEINAMSPLELRAVVERVQSEFLEMPGLQLTIPQAARLWGLEISACEQVVDVLIQSAFLRRTGSGAVTRSGG